jgi:hypothetical protein
VIGRHIEGGLHEDVDITNNSQRPVRFKREGIEAGLFVPEILVELSNSAVAFLRSTFVYPEFAAGALEVLAEYQATERDDYRDAEPGKAAGAAHHLSQQRFLSRSDGPHARCDRTVFAREGAISLEDARRMRGDRAAIFSRAVRLQPDRGLLAGLDVGRLHWSATVPLALQILGLAIAQT